ncbi:hypothetical protein PG994_011585 [Apiospora phragmitis]|uniref:Low temperature requirement A n=1 Tax=Apiospora phragmitis TaxID=2905665 RepID=A0ABR1TT79_9PEZI
MPTGSDLDYAGERIRLISTRIQDCNKPPNHALGHDDDHHTASVITPSDLDIPSHAASNFELFYDLWFVANLSVFASIHAIVDGAALRSFVGYILLLWTTWLVTSIYDVRFTSESILERCCRGAHLGVMTGFAVIATKFNPDKQIMAVYRAMSLFLAVSRLILTVQYGLSAWQVRKFKHGRRPLLATAAFHFVAAVAYIVIAFRYGVGKNSRGYIAWYVIGLAEMALHLGCSQFSPVLTFIGTHFGERLNLLTLIVMGEGVIILAKNITLVVKDTYLKDAALTVWNPDLIGIVTSAPALIYIIFQLYFDWMHGEDESMSTRHQVWWAALHLPFHIAMLLLVEGSNQFISWWRMLESIEKAANKLLDLSDVDPTSEAVADALSKQVLAWLKKYPPLDIIDSYKDVNTTLEDIRGLPDSLWGNTTIADDDPTALRWSNDVTELFMTMINGIFNNFKVEAPEKEKGGDKVAANGSSGVLPQTAMVDAMAQRFGLVFIYTFICAGIVLLEAGRPSTSSAPPFELPSPSAWPSSPPWPPTKTPSTLSWAALNAPTITLSYLTALILTHLPHPRRFGLGKFGRGTYEGVYKRQHGEENVPLKHVVTDVIITRLGQDYEPYEGRTGVFMPTGADMAPSPGYNVTVDAHHPLQSSPHTGALGYM